MNPEIKADWVAALRSGEYKQGFGKLNDDQGGFCCLGVLCELAVNQGVIGKWSSDEIINTVYYGNRRSGQSGILLPPLVQQWAGLGASPYVRFKDGISSLASLNDAGCSFDVIADVIEQQL